VLGTSFGTLEQRDGVIEGAEFDRRWAIALDVTWATTVVANHFDALPVVGVITHLKSKSPFLRGTRLDGLGEVHGVRGAKIGGSSSVTSHIHASLLQAVQRVTGAHGITVGVIVLDAVRSLIDMWVPDLGLALRVRPGMTQSSGADCSAPAPGDFFLPLAGVTAHVRPARRPPPGGHSPASHAGDAPGGT
jgi:hypothetical protein